VSTPIEDTCTVVPSYPLMKINRSISFVKFLSSHPSSDFTLSVIEDAKGKEREETSVVRSFPFT
jgi:hypothetical protein